jgi:hypothetical protein
MIVKKILFKKQSKASFQKLADYTLDVENNHSKVLVDYMLDVDHGMEKVEAYQFSNCSFDDDQNNIDEILNTQKLNTTSTQDKTMHLVVSFQEDETPSLETLRAIEKDLMDALGMEHHQRLSVVHSNTNNLHIHIAINKVDPVTLKVVNPYNDVGILQDAAAKIEKKYNLKIDNHISNSDKEQNKYNIHSMTCQFESWVKEKLADPVNTLLKDEKTTFEDLQKLLSEYDLEFRERRKGFVIASKSDKLFCKASTLHRDLSKQQLEKRFGKLELIQDLQTGNGTDQKRVEADPGKKFNKFEGMPPNPLWEKYQEIEKQKKLELERELKHIKLRRNEFRNSIPSMNYTKETFGHIKNQRMIFKRQTVDLYRKYKRVSYRDFLLKEAFNGDEEATKLLRKTKSKINLEDNTLSSNQDKPKFFTNVDYITKEGFAVYKDKTNKLIDKGEFLKVSFGKDDNKEFILESLLMSIDRFGKELNITGEERFKKTILDVVNEYNLDVRFTDKNMQKIHENNKVLRQELEARKVLLKAINRKMEIVKNDDQLDEEKRDKEMITLQKFHKKASKSTASIFAGELKKLGLDYSVIDSMDTEEVDIKVDSFLVNDRNMDGLRAMNNEVMDNIKDEEKERFEKFVKLFENSDKITDVTVGFYENRKVEVEDYIEDYNMTATKLDKKANAIQLTSDRNLKIIQEFSDQLAAIAKMEKVEIIQSTDEGLTNF